MAKALMFPIPRHGRTVVAEARAPVSPGPFSSETRSADALLGRFVDLTHAYRFGPPGHAAVVARLRDAEGAVLHEDVVYPGAPPLHPEPAGVLEARVEQRPMGYADLILKSEVLLHGVSLEIKGAQAQDDHFDLTPGVERAVRFVTDGGRAKVGVTAVNLAGGVTVRG
jgi:beta-mannosidase